MSSSDMADFALRPQLHYDAVTESRADDLIADQRERGADAYEKMARVYEKMARVYAGRPDQGYCEMQAERCRAKARMMRRGQ